MSSVNDIEKRIQKLERFCLSREEQKQAQAFDRAEILALKEQKRRLAGFAVSSASGVLLALPIGAVNAVRNAYEYEKFQLQKNRARNQREKLLQKVQERYEKAMRLGVKCDDYQKGCDGYGR